MEGVSVGSVVVLLKKWLNSDNLQLVVDGNRLHDDARLTDIIEYDNGCWGIFAAKIITSEKTAKELATRIDNFS